MWEDVSSTNEQNYIPICANGSKFCGHRRLFFPVFRRRVQKMRDENRILVSEKRNAHANTAPASISPFRLKCSPRIRDTNAFDIHICKLWACEHRMGRLLEGKLSKDCLKAQAAHLHENAIRARERPNTEFASITAVHDNVHLVLCVEAWFEVHWKQERNINKKWQEGRLLSSQSVIKLSNWRRSMDSS